jgi:hypothetical protein
VKSVARNTRCAGEGLESPKDAATGKEGVEGFVVRRKESAASIVAQAAFSIARTICRPAQTSSDSGLVDRPGRSGTRAGFGEPKKGFETARVL